MNSPIAEVQDFKTTTSEIGPSPETGGFEQILVFYGLTYKQFECYFQVGEITRTQGWLLHISVVVSQIEEALHKIIPILIKEQIPFKIIQNYMVCEDILAGHLGFSQIGKTITVYPETNSKASSIAAILVQATKEYKGPMIPTDLYLGGSVYTRYGAFSPIKLTDIDGIDENYIYDTKGELIKDVYHIPFKLPLSVSYPFDNLQKINASTPDKNFNHIFKATSLLKLDPRGSVYKGLFLKHIFKIKKCVIKEGIKNMSSDPTGRDMTDRLNWQRELHPKLSPFLHVPEIFGQCENERASFLIMQYVAGISLYEKAQQLNPKYETWLDIKGKITHRIIDYLKAISNIVKTLHNLGYIHRDIQPVNFLIAGRNAIYIIDMELTYSIRDDYPQPPFTLGTEGFMSPEQMIPLKPTTKEDIYGLGATLLVILTGITPSRLYTKEFESLKNNISFFIGDCNLATIISRCLSKDPSLRPEISVIESGLVSYQRQLQNHHGKNKNHTPLNINKLQETITGAIAGLIEPPIASSGNLWYSKNANAQQLGDIRSREFSKYIGLGVGMSGILYTIARVNALGISVYPCTSRYLNSWDYIWATTLSRLDEVSPGLYSGLAGVAVALIEGIRTGLAENNEQNRERIKQMFEFTPQTLNLADGISGQGIAILQCLDFLDRNVYLDRLKVIANNLLISQRQDGSWNVPMRLNGGGKTPSIYNIDCDTTGIIYFLLEYGVQLKDPEALNAAKKGIHNLMLNRSNIKMLYKLSGTGASYDVMDGGKGLILTLIRAYDIFQNNEFKTIAQTALKQYPQKAVNVNFTQYGLAGLGELYLEAATVFQEEEWLLRSNWIANVFLHTFRRTKGLSGFWVMDDNNHPTADLLTGNSGIIHFLGRCMNFNKLGYRILR